MPQDNSKWSHNLIYSNNNNLFTDERDAYCRDTPWAAARPAEGLPDVPGAGRHRAPDRRRQRQHRRGELHLRQLAPRHDAALGAGHPARRGGLREDLRHVGEQPVPGQLHGHPADGPRQRRLLGLPGARRTRTASTSGGTRRRARTASRSSPAASTTTPSSATAGPATSASTARRTPATRRRCCCRPVPGWTRSGRATPRSRRPGAVRDVAPDRQPGPARVRLVHHAA